MYESGFYSKKAPHVTDVRYNVPFVAQPANTLTTAVPPSIDFATYSPPICPTGGLMLSPQHKIGLTVGFSPPPPNSAARDLYQFSSHTASVGWDEDAQRRHAILTRELQVTKQQLAEAQAECARLREEVSQAGAREMILRRHVEDSTKMCAKTVRVEVSRANNAVHQPVPSQPPVVYYVPPDNFLPEYLVSKHKDVLDVVERYARLYFETHNPSAGGGGITLVPPKAFGGAAGRSVGHSANPETHPHHSSESASHQPPKSVAETAIHGTNVKPSEPLNLDPSLTMSNLAALQSHLPVDGTMSATTLLQTFSGAKNPEEDNRVTALEAQVLELKNILKKIESQGAGSGESVEPPPPPPPQPEPEAPSPPPVEVPPPVAPKSVPSTSKASPQTPATKTAPALGTGKLTSLLKTSKEVPAAPVATKTLAKPTQSQEAVPTTTTTANSVPSDAELDELVKKAIESGEWKEVKDPKSGKSYFSNTKTKATTWDLKKELSKK